MTELTHLTIAEARSKLRAKEITAAEITDAYLGEIDAHNDLIEEVNRSPRDFIARPPSQELEVEQ